MNIIDFLLGRKMAGGVSLPELTDPAVEKDVFYNKEFIDADGNKRVGSLLGGIVDTKFTPAMSSYEFTEDELLQAGSRIYVESDEVTVNPGAADVIVDRSQEDNFIKKVTVPGDSNLLPENIKQGVSVFGVEGTLAAGGSVEPFITDISFMFQNGVRLEKYSKIKSLCGQIIAATQAFYYCPTSFTEVDLTGIDFSKCYDFQSMFASCNYLATIKGIDSIDVSSATLLSNMFNGCKGLTSVDLSGWSTAPLEFYGFSGMFRNCNKLTKVGNLSGFNVGKVTSFEFLFYRCEKLANMSGLSSWNTSKVTNMRNLFYGCRSLPTASIREVESWDVSNVENMDQMFSGCARLTTFDMSNWDMSKVTSFVSMFNSCFSLESIIGFSCPGYTNSDIDEYMFNGVIKRLTFRTDLGDGVYAIKSSFSLLGQLFERAGMVEMFNTIPDIATGLGITRNITIGENPCITGILDDGITPCETLTDADRAIATAKGWTLVE